MVFAHFPAGYILTKIFDRYRTVPKSHKIFLWVGSIAPDFDLVATPFFPNTSHREFITHTPFLYTTLSIGVIAWYLKSKSIHAERILFFLIGCWLHLLLDLPTGLLLYYPVSMERIQLTQERLSFFEYFQTPLFLLEFVFIIPFFILLILRKNTETNVII